MNLRLLFLAVPLLATLLSNRPAAEPSESVQEILRSHERDREDHLRGDAADLTSRLPAEYISVADGKLKHLTREGTLKQFQEYFASRKHRAWEDLEPPVVHVAPSGEMAWAIFRVRSRYTDVKPDGSRQDGEFVCAWTSTYEKRDGKWWMTSVTSTFEPDPPVKGKK